MRVCAGRDGDSTSLTTNSYSHTLNLTPLLPYIRALTPPKGSTSSQASYLASDIPAELARDPIAGEAATKQKTTLLSFLVKGLLLALEEHPIMRARVKEKDGQRWLEIGRDAVLGVAVSGKSHLFCPRSGPPADSFRSQIRATDSLPAAHAAYGPSRPNHLGTQHSSAHSEQAFYSAYNDHLIRRCTRRGPWRHACLAARRRRGHLRGRSSTVGSRVEGCGQ